MKTKTAMAIEKMTASLAGQGDARAALIEEAIGCLNLIEQPPLVDQARRALVRALAARQPVGVSSDTLRALADRWASDRGYTGSPVDDIRALIDEPTPARQPVGDSTSVAVIVGELASFVAHIAACASNRDGTVTIPASVKKFAGQLTERCDSMKLVFNAVQADGPSAQAVDPEQLPPRWVVEFWHRFGHRDEANKLLALIDSQGVKK